MGLKMKVGIVGVTAAAIAGLAMVPTSAQAQQAPLAPSVRTEASSAPDLLEVGDTATDTTRATRAAGPALDVEVDTALLAPGVSRTVSIDVPDGDLEVALKPIASGTDGWAAWKGSLTGQPDAVATVVRNGDDVAGIISAPDGTYRIRTTAAGEQIVQEIERTFPDKVDDHVVPPATLDLGISPDAPAADPSSKDAPPVAGDVPTYPVIDVLVAYTPGALADAGTLSSMNSEIALAIATTNTAYINSGVNGRVRLAGTTALADEYDLSSESLGFITGTSDGRSDSIHALRNSTGADLVSVLVRDPSSCGLAWVLNSVTASASNRSPYGFSTVNYDCAVDNFSFPHELGHNMGLNHDRYVTPSPTLYDYAVGYVNVAKEWRTIMAYNDACAAQSTYCARLGRFSNPSQTYEGAALGRPIGGSNPADNRTALNNTHGFVSSWRAKPAPFTSWTKFVAQQYKDFLGRSPSSSESSSAASSLNTGVITPQAYIQNQLNGSFGSTYGPVARLYFAYFVRSPDKGGLDYWANKYKAGMKLSAISSNFAASNEFKTKYGSLTNRQFVEKIYNNLFERNGDAAGIDYWTGKLDTKVKTRGAVMIGFSESSEFKRVRAEEISIVLLYRSLLGRSATPSEFSSQVARLQGGTSVQRLILEIVDSAEYSGRVTK